MCWMFCVVCCCCGVSGRPMSCRATVSVVVMVLASAPQKVLPIPDVSSMGNPCCMLVGRSLGLISRMCLVTAVGWMFALALASVSRCTCMALHTPSPALDPLLGWLLASVACCTSKVLSTPSCAQVPLLSPTCWLTKFFAACTTLGQNHSACAAVVSGCPQRGQGLGWWWFMWWRCCCVHVAPVAMCCKMVW